MHNEFTNQQDANRKLTYSKGQQKILDTVWEFGGNAVEAAKAAGYSNPYAAVDSVQDELIAMAEKAMARLAIKSVVALEKVLDSTYKEPVPQATEKLKACQLILDRTNPKTEKIDINAEVKGGVFILPEKRPVVEEDDGE